MLLSVTHLVFPEVFSMDNLMYPQLEAEVKSLCDEGRLFMLLGLRSSALDVLSITCLFFCVYVFSQKLAARNGSRFFLPIRKKTLFTECINSLAIGNLCMLS